MPHLELYTYWRSSSSYRVRIALGFKKLAWTPRFVNLLEGEQKAAGYKETSPMGYVPTLVVDGKPFVESVAILELIEELAPEPALLPRTNPEDRACVRALVQIINAGTQPLQNLSILERVAPAEEKERRKEWLQHFIGRGLAAFEALARRFEDERGGKGPFAFGESFTMADVFLVPQVYAARRFGIDLSAMPIVERAERASLALSFVERASPEAQGDAKPAPSPA
jgi:maleylacetoacetate isomerase